MCPLELIEKDKANTLYDRLGMEPERARDRLFWIHRANCYVEKGREHVLQHCSSKYIPRALDAVGPRLVIILGRHAAQYFFQFDRLGEVVEGCPRECEVKGCRYRCFVLYHPSPANKHYQREKIHRETVNNLRKELKAGTPIREPHGRRTDALTL